MITGPLPGAVVDSGTARPYLPPVPQMLEPTAWREWLARIARTLNAVVAGNMNCVADITLDAGATETLLQDERIGAWSVLLPVASSASGAAALQAGLWIETTKGSAILHHASDPATDQHLRIAIIG